MWRRRKNSKKTLWDMVRRVARTHPGAEIQIWVHDEARFGQKGSLTRVWARRGSRPRAPKQTQYQSLYLTGAVCPATGAAAAILTPTLDTRVMNLFFEELATQIPEGVHVILILDRAGYHMSDDLRVPKNVTLLHLPPYSPELNPMENLWHYLRSHHWSNRIHPSYDALLDAATEAWRALCLVPERISSICNFPYLRRALGTN
jgi:transposase